MKFIKQIIIAVVFFLVILLIGTLFYHNVEELNYLDSVYFSVVTMTTVGYGDFHPLTDAGKIFTIFYIFAGLFTVFYLLSAVGKYIFMRMMRERLLQEGRINNNRGMVKIRNK